MPRELVPINPDELLAETVNSRAHIEHPTSKHSLTHLNNQKQHNRTKRITLSSHHLIIQTPPQHTQSMPISRNLSRRNISPPKRIPHMRQRQRRRRRVERGITPEPSRDLLDKSPVRPSEVVAQVRVDGEVGLVD